LLRVTRQFSQFALRAQKRRSDGWCVQKVGIPVHDEIFVIQNGRSRLHHGSQLFREHLLCRRSIHLCSVVLRERPDLLRKGLELTETTCIDEVFQHLIDQRDQFLVHPRA